jgi:hypothetical protein
VLATKKFVLVKSNNCLKTNPTSKTLTIHSEKKITHEFLSGEYCISSIKIRVDPRISNIMVKGGKSVPTGKSSDKKRKKKSSENKVEKPNVPEKEKKRKRKNKSLTQAQVAITSKKIIILIQDFCQDVEEIIGDEALAFILRVVNTDNEKDNMPSNLKKILRDERWANIFNKYSFELELLHGHRLSKKFSIYYIQSILVVYKELKQSEELVNDQKERYKSKKEKEEDN